MRWAARVSQAFFGGLLIAGLLVPVGVLLGRILSGGSEGLGSSWSIMTDPPIRRALSNTFALASVTSVLGTAFAFTASWLLWRFEFRWGAGRKLGTLLKIPYLLPPFLFAMGWIALGAPEVGYLTRVAKAAGVSAPPTVYGLGGAIFVMTLWNVALGMIQLQPFFDSFPGQLEDAAVLCGASPRVAFARITLPLARPQIGACLLLMFIQGLAAFGVPAMLAAPARDYVLTTRIQQALKSGGGLEGAADAGVLTLALLGIAGLLLLLQRLLARRGGVALVTGKAGRPALLRPGLLENALLGFLCVFAVISVLLPCAAVFVQSVLADRGDLGSWTLDRYAHVFLNVPGAALSVWNSLVTAAAASLALVALASVVAYSAVRDRSRGARALIGASSLAYAVPGTVIALALLVAFAGSFTDTLGILALAYFVKDGAFALRTLVPAVGNLAPELEEAAWMSGASRWVGFRAIVLGLLRPALAAALFLSFLPMFSELTMSVLLAGPGTETLGVMIYRFQDYADPGSAAVLGVLLVTVTLCVNGMLRWLTKGKFGI